MDSKNRKSWGWDRLGRRTPVCAEVTRELAAPTGAPLPAELAEHLASCPACTAREPPRRRAWTASGRRPARPSPPPPAGTRSGPKSPAPRRHATRSRTCPTRRLVPRGAWIGAVAAAAALLVAVLHLLPRRPPGPRGRPDHDPPAAVLDQHFEVESGQLLTLHIDDQGVQADRRPQEADLRDGDGPLGPRALQRCRIDHHGGPMVTRSRRAFLGWGAAVLVLAGPALPRTPAQVEPSRQVTLFGVAAVPGSPAIDPKLATGRSPAAPALARPRLPLAGRQERAAPARADPLLRPDRGLGRRRPNWSTPSTPTARSSSASPWTTTARSQFSTGITTPPNQLTFCEKTLPISPAS